MIDIIDGFKTDLEHRDHKDKMSVIFDDLLDKIEFESESLLQYLMPYVDELMDAQDELDQIDPVYNVDETHWRDIVEIESGIVGCMNAIDRCKDRIMCWVRRQGNLLFSKAISRQRHLSEDFAYLEYALRRVEVDISNPDAIARIG